MNPDDAERQVRSALAALREIEDQARFDLRTSPQDSVAFGHADGRIEACQEIRKRILSPED